MWRMGSKAMNEAYQVKYCKVLDTWTGGYVGWGYFIVELWPIGTRFALEHVESIQSAAPAPDTTVASASRYDLGTR